MVLERKYYNNGYGCQCCRRDWEKSEWIEEARMIPIDNIIDEALTSPLEGRVGLIYEKDGRILYGYTSDIGSFSSYVFFVKEDKKIKVVNLGKPLYTKEQIKKEVL